VLLSGYAGAWVGAAASYGPELLRIPWTWGPTYLVGNLWFVVGVPLAALLAWRGYLGFAGLAISPYVLPQYWLFPLIDVFRPRGQMSSLSRQPEETPRREATRAARRGG
jgi:hypothetical protein